MRKSLFTFIVVFIICSLSLHANANERKMDIFIDNTKLNLSVDPVLKNGVTFVQFRPIFESLGYNVKWDSGMVYADKHDSRFILTIGSNLALVNYDTVEMEKSYAPIIMQGNTLVPLRFISEYSGKEVEWDSNNRQIHIKSKQVSPNQKITPKKCSELTECISQKDENAIKEILLKTSNITDKQFEEAVKSGNESIVQLLLDHGYDLKGKTSKIKSKMLSIVVENRSFKLIELLIDSGIDPDIDLFDYLYSETALLKAVKNNDYDLAKLLLEKGADPLLRYSGSAFDRNNEYYTAANLAYKSNYMNIYELLMNYARNSANPPAAGDFEIKGTLDLRAYIEKYCSRLNTNLGIVVLHYAIEENTKDYLEYDYNFSYTGEVWFDEKLGLGMNYMNIEDLISDNRFSNTQKEEFNRQLKQFTESSARGLISLLPDKKLTGGFCRFTSYVPDGIPWELRSIATDVYGSSIKQFFTWTNYSPEYSRDYQEAHITNFHWNDFLDDKNYTTDYHSLKKISIPYDTYKVGIGESITIPYSLSPTDATGVELQWEVDKKDLASVDANGVVVGLNEGLVKITVYSKNDPKIKDYVLVEVGDYFKMK